MNCLDLLDELGGGGGGGGGVTIFFLKQRV